MRDLTKGPITKNLILFSIPLFLGNFLQMLYNMVDTAYVGRLGQEALAAVSMSFSVLFVLVSAGVGLTIGTTTMVSQYLGARRPEMVKRTIANSLFFVGALAVIISIAGILTARPMLRLLGAPDEIMAPSMSYLRIIMAGMLPSFLFFQISAILRGAGDSKTPLYFLAVATVLNIIGDPLLIYGLGPFPRMGVAGAAIATVFAQMVAAILAVIHLMRRQGPLRLTYRGFRPDWRIIWDTIRLGVPAAIQQTVVAVGGSVVVRVVSSFGTTALAVYSMGSKVDSIAMMPSMSLGVAVAAMTGQNLGAGREDRVRKVAKSSVLLILAILLVFAAFVSLFPGVMIGIFTDKADLFPPAAAYIRSLAVGYLFFGIIFVLGGVFRGAGAMIVPMFITLLSLWAARVPLALFLSRIPALGPRGIWIGISLSAAIGAAAHAVYYFFGGWARKVLVHGGPTPDLLDEPAILETPMSLPAGDLTSGEYAGKICPRCLFPIEDSDGDVSCKHCGAPYRRGSREEESL